MAGLVISPQEKDLLRVVQVTRQLMEGRTNSVGTVILSSAGFNGITGLIVSFGGFGYSDGVINLTGGTGSGATANIVTSIGTVTGAAIVNPGSGYTIGDILTSLGGSGAGLQLSVTSVGGLGTVVLAPTCSPSSIVFLTPMNSHAILVTPTPFVPQTTIKKGQFSIANAAPPFNDCLFGWDCRG